MIPDRKVYDSDLVRVPLLREIAETYTREYVGNFDMMIEAQHRLWANGELEVGLLRSVLNTLRTDPLRQDLWAAVQAVLPQINYREMHDRDRLEKKKAQERRAKVVSIRPESRRVCIDMRTTIKMPYGMAKPSGPARRVIHHVKPEARIRWARPRTDFGDRMELPMVPEAIWFNWLCHSGATTPVFLAEIPEGMPECRKCWCVANGVEYP